MDNSKLIITKPGGLTSTEAINKHLPMIIPFYIPGQEEENTAFLVGSKEDMLDYYSIKKVFELYEMLV